jgi:hypothetical protein
MIQFIFLGIIVYFILLNLVFAFYPSSSIEYINITKTPKYNVDIVILGCARNISRYLEKTFKVIEMMRSCFTKSAVIIYENDSNDNTLEKLYNYKNKHKHVTIINEKHVKGTRTQRLAHGRNMILKHSLETYNSKYTIVMDLDDVNLLLTREAFLSSFSLNIKWDVITANQVNKYYDLWALRTYDNWMPFDCWKCSTMSSYILVWYCVWIRFINVRRDQKPILVKSAFGGLGIYKTQIIRNVIEKYKFAYIGGPLFNEQCEHVSLNNLITKEGGKIFINPLMINSYGY